MQRIRVFIVKKENKTIRENGRNGGTANIEKRSSMGESFDVRTNANTPEK